MAPLKLTVATTTPLKLTVATMTPLKLTGCNGTIKIENKCDDQMYDISVIGIYRYD
jgi:hypothetical protein